MKMSYEGGGDGGTAGADDVGGSGSSRRKVIYLSHAQF